MIQIYQIYKAKMPYKKQWDIYLNIFTKNNSY